MDIRKHAIIKLYVLILSGIVFAQGVETSPPDSIVSVYLDLALNDIPLVIVLPTHEQDQDIQQQIHTYVREIFDTKSVTYLTDEEALAQSLAGKNILAYGTPTGNTWLAEHISSLPIQIEPNEIIADQRIVGTDLRLLAVWDNPEDPGRGLIVYTAQQAAQVVGIHDIQTGANQFLVAQARQILKQGFYLWSATGWSFAELPAFCPDLTYEQKLEDFDTLAQLIRDVFPRAHANKVVFGLDIEEIFSTYRALISPFSSMLDFIEILDQTIKACRGGHLDTSHVTSASYASNDFLRSYTAGYLNDQIVRIHEVYFRHLLTRKPEFQIRLNLPLIYYQGDYYVQHDFAYADQVFPRGLKVDTCNRHTPDQIVAEHQDQIAMLPWDFDLGKFYYHRFYVMGMPAHLDTLDFVFRSPDQVLIPMSFPINTRLTYETPERQNGKVVTYLPVSKLLYIRIPDMNPDHIPFYEQGILSEGGRSGRSRREVRAAVVDIRNNGGGSDLVWRRVLGKLLDRSITCENHIGVRYSSTVLDYIGQSLPGPEEAETIPFLGDEKFLTQTSWETLSPDSDSIRVPRIYVLSDNVFSAAGTLTSLAALAEPLVSVGYTNPYSMGMGVDPFYFSLPHSSYVFRIGAVIDLTGCTSVLDVYHADVEVQVQPTLDQVLDFHNQPMEGTLEDFLIQYDPIFQAVLQLAP